MKNKFKIGSFYSISSPYAKIVRDYLMDSCTKLGLFPYIMETPNYHNWYRNVAEKPKAILSLLNNVLHNNECLVFIDADARVEEYPKLFEEIPLEYDIAFHTLNWNTWYGYKQNPPVMELLTGTMFFRNRKLIKELCKEWYDKAIQTREWEQKVLEQIIKKYPIKIYDLPLEYSYMNSTPRGEPIVKIEKPVIVHYQKSRELKRKLI